MKLQPKRQITAELATQKKAQIDEGLLLAKKIDTLRATLLEEEGKLERFRKETIAKTQADIDTFVRQLDSIKRDIKSAERKLAISRIPLDAEWERVRTEGKKVRDGAIKLESIAATLEERQKEIENHEREGEIEKGRITDFRHTVLANLAESEKTLENAREKASSIRNHAQLVLSNAELKQTESNDREKKIVHREKEMELREAANLAKEIDLAERETRVRDQYATLLRNNQRRENGKRRN